MTVLEQLGLVLAIAGIVISIALALRATTSKSQSQKIGDNGTGFQAGRDIKINDRENSEPDC